MKHLNPAQVEFLTHQLEFLTQQRSAYLKELTDAVEPGDLAYKLGWVTENLALTDHQLHMLSEFQAACEYDKRPKLATPEEFIGHYTRKLIEWYPERSSNPVRNIVADAKQQALKRTLEQFEIMAGLGKEVSNA